MTASKEMNEIESLRQEVRALSNLVKALVKGRETVSGLDVIPAAEKNVVRVFKHPSRVPVDQNGPVPGWNLGTTIGGNGEIETNAWVNVCGHMERDEEGGYKIRDAAPLNYMVGVWSDVIGPAVVARCLHLPETNERFNESYPLACLNGAGEHVLRVQSDGSIFFPQTGKKFSPDGAVR